MHFQEWGAGDPLITIHPLALESTVFAGVAQRFDEIGLRTLSVDLPGFGQTLVPDGVPLTPGFLAEPVVDLARGLERPPIILGMSLGGRVALEAALVAPEAVRGVVLVAPYLPWRTSRRAVELARYLDPEWAHRLPLEHLWPVLKHTSSLLDALPALENDWFARACVRVAYYSTCPATRVAFLSASREMAIEPAYGEEGLWTRLATLKVPVVFLWLGRDRLIPSTHAGHVAEVLPGASQLEASCSGHFVNFIHYACLEHAMALAVERLLAIEQQPETSTGTVLTPCIAKGSGYAARSSATVRGGWGGGRCPASGESAQADVGAER